MKSILIRLLIYVSYIIFSTIFVVLTGFNGERIETREELANAFPMKTGFPLHFAELRYPHIDPPLPWNYGGNCCSFFITSWTHFWLDLLFIFLFLLIATECTFYIMRKVR